LSATFDPSGVSKAVSWEIFSTVFEDCVALTSVPFRGRRGAHGSRLLGAPRDFSSGQGISFLSATLDI
jgi:hypothetical protein